MRQILVYKFNDAPQELRELSNNGGDWLAVVPDEHVCIYKEMGHTYYYPPSWMSEGSEFARIDVNNYDINHYDHPTDSTLHIFIGART